MRPLNLRSAKIKKRTDSRRNRRSARLPLLGAILLLGAGRVQAEQQNQYAGQSQAPMPPAATLQVTEKEGRFTVSADHADVQTVLKLLFEQADKQFVLDSSVTGQVTMRLTGQPLATTLDALCAQTFLRYRFDPATNIYRFERNEEAVKAAFAHLREMNALLRQQLRLMGLDLPTDSQLHLYNLGGVLQNDSLNTPGLSAGGGFGFGGAGGGRATGPAGPTGQAVAGSRNEAATKQMLRESVNNPKAPEEPRGGKEGYTKIKPGREREQTRDKKDADSVIGRPAPNKANSNAQEPGTTLGFRANNVYDDFLNQNNFVWFSVPVGQPVPVTDVLAEFGKQANVAILVDPGVPSGPQFRIDGRISPRPLPEALNVLAPIARLEWRWVGDRIFVTTAPDFQIFYGNTPEPRAVFRRQNAAPQQRSMRKARATMPGKNVPAPQKEPSKEKGKGD